MTTYAIVPATPPLPEDAWETERAAIEVEVRWGESLIHFESLSPPRSIWLGGRPGDVVLPEEILGGRRTPLVTVDGDVVTLVVAPGMKGVVRTGSQAREVVAGQRIELPSHARAEIDLGGVSIRVEAGYAVAPPRERRIGSRPAAFAALSGIVHAAFLSAGVIFLPPMSLTDEPDLDAERRHQLAQMLQVAAERETDARALPAAESPHQVEGGTGAAARAEPGSMGASTAAVRGGRYGVATPTKTRDPEVTRFEALRDAATFGMIHVISSAGDAAPRSPFGDFATGNDAASAAGSLWGSSIEEAGGAGGLALSGIGEAGGGRGAGIGLGLLGTIGHGAGTGDGQGFGPGVGFGSGCGCGSGGGGSGRLGGKHKAGVPLLRQGSISVNGRLPPEVIQRVLRQSFGRFQSCYESGLRANPSLAGRVVTSFVIGRDGAVYSAGNAGGDLPDASVASCVARAVQRLSFPAPEGGVVKVTYPIVFTPGA